VKHMAPEHDSLFGTLCDEAGISLDDLTRTRLLEYLDRVIEANQSLNLTRITTPVDAVRLHLVDSLLAVQEVETSPQGPLLDIGTGGGFPGAVLCIAVDRPGVLLDSVAKKSRAVNAILDGMGLELELRSEAQRAEEHAVSHPAHYAVVTARAVAQLPALVELASPLLVTGGRLIALKGAPDSSELARGRAAATLVGMREVSVRFAELPGGGENRCIVVYERAGKSRTRLPRRTGLAQNTPLA